MDLVIREEYEAVVCCTVVGCGQWETFERFYGTMLPLPFEEFKELLQSRGCIQDCVAGQPCDETLHSAGAMLLLAIESRGLQGMLHVCS